MKVEFIDEARIEFVEAAIWYEHQEPGLGIKFREEVAYVCEKLSSFPYLWREVAEGYRRVNCPVFPYFIAYKVIQKKIIVFAVGHGHREPDYWKSRKARPRSDV